MSHRINFLGLFMYNFCISLCIMFVLLIYYDLKWSNCISYYITCSSCFRNGDIFGKETLRASLWIVPFRIIKSLFVLVNTLCAEPNVSLRSGSQFWFLFVFIILAMHLPIFLFSTLLNLFALPIFYTAHNGVFFCNTSYTSFSFNSWN